MLRAALCSLAVAAAAGVAGAQPLTWEPVGDLDRLEWIGFDGDTMYVVRGTGRPWTLSHAPGDSTFAQAFPDDTFAPGLVRTRGDTLLIRNNAHVSLSADGGATWHAVFSRAYSDPVVLPSGTVLVGTRGNEDGHGALAARSTDGGATWAFVGLGDGAGVGTEVFVAVPPAPAYPAGRVVAAGFNGVAFSDDDGETWAPSDLHGALAYAADAAALVPTTGRVVAVVGSNLGPVAVYGSDDGGATWAPLGPAPGTARPALVGAPDGSVYLVQRYGDDRDREARPVWRSADGGATWEDVGTVWDGWRAVPKAAALGPDGRLYVGTGGRSEGFGVRVGGLFRTVDPVWAVAGAPGPGRAALAVTVSPNPSGGAVRVEVAGAPGPVRVSVVDVLGREVAVLHDGPLAGGARLAVPRLAPGAYRVVVRAGAGVASAGLTVAR